MPLTDQQKLLAALRLTLWQRALEAGESPDPPSWRRIAETLGVHEATVYTYRMGRPIAPSVRERIQAILSPPEGV